MSSQVVVITGAASGIGAAIALSFAKLNAGLCITDKNEEDLNKTSIECHKLSKTKVLEVVGDLTKNEDLENIVKSAVKEFGKIDVLVNCAGICELTKLQDPNIIEIFDKIVAINLRSIIALTHKALPALIESKGCIINISSVASSYVSSGYLPYSLAKVGVTTFTKHAAFELANFGIRVNCISPGPVKTNINKNLGTANCDSDTFWDGFIDITLLRKIIKPEEIAELAVYLASDKATSITGSDFTVDAGMLLASGIQKKQIDKEIVAIRVKKMMRW